jgi:hypothetical protein
MSVGSGTSLGRRKGASSYFGKERKDVTEESLKIS